jgi:hypothetical protein
LCGRFEGLDSEALLVVNSTGDVTSTLEAAK